MDFLARTQRWISYYHQLPGRRAQVVTFSDEVPEVFWILGQEQGYLVCAQEPFDPDATKRRFTVLDSQHIERFNLLGVDPAPEASALPHGSSALFDPTEMICALARVSVHATTPSGSRHHIELSALEPVYGGFFLTGSHVLGFALNHVHRDLQAKGLVGPDPLPMRDGWRELPSPVDSAPLPDGQQPSATLTVYVLDTRADQLAGLTAPVTTDRASARVFGTPERVMVWGYEVLIEQAINRRILPSGFRPRIRRNLLG